MRLFASLALLALAAADPAFAARPVQVTQAAPTAGALVLPLGQAGDLETRGGSLDAVTRQAVARALASARFDYGVASTLSLRGIGPWSQILVIGTGNGRLSAGDLQRIGAVAARDTAGETGPVSFLGTGLGPDAGQVAIGASLGSYSFDTYRFRDPQAARAQEQKAPFSVIAQGGPVQDWRQRGDAIARSVAFTRDLISEPANIIYPESFVERTRAAFRGAQNVSIEVLDVPAMERLGMGAILSVGKGADRPPRMLIVHYRGAEGAPVVLAGKGITFDSGGISLKPGAGMWEMKGDMAGAAAVVGAVHALARGGAPVNVVAIAALAENMPSGRATRPGDVVRAINGKSIEILNTDAEGRLVLADAVAYAEQRFRPAAIVDVATLTGAKVTALGDEYAGLFSRSDTLADQLTRAGEATGEPLWRLPLHPNYARDMRSEFADIKNVVEGGGPGAGLGAHFIGYFVTDATPWAHLDIAGMDFNGNGPLTPNGVAGFGVRLLERFVRDFRTAPAGSSAAQN